MEFQSWSQFLSDTEYLIRMGGLVLLLLLVFLETGVLLGIVLPGGDYMLFTAGLLCGSPYLELPLWLLLLLLWLAAVAGDVTGFFKGRWLGPRLFDKPENKIFKPVFLFKTRKLWIRFGVYAFIVGRFLPIVRTLLPMMSGASQMGIRRFLLYDVVGGAIWVGVLVSAGFLIGRQFPQVFDYMHYLLLGIVLVASIPVVKLFLQKQPPQS